MSEPAPQMNISFDDSVNVNNLNRADPELAANVPWLATVRNAFCVWVNENGRMTDAKDLFFRFSIPLISIGMTAAFKYFLDARERDVIARENAVSRRENQLTMKQKQLQQKEALASGNRTLNELLEVISRQEEHKAEKARQEVDLYQQMIKQWLAIRCSPTTRRQHRKPIEQDLRVHILRQPSPFDDMGSMKEMIFTDIDNIYAKDDAHCDFVWPLGSGDHGELYKVYKDKWNLKIELLKYKNIVERLKAKDLV